MFHQVFIGGGARMIGRYSALVGEEIQVIICTPLLFSFSIFVFLIVFACLFCKKTIPCIIQQRNHVSVEKNWVVTVRWQDRGVK